MKEVFFFFQEKYVTIKAVSFGEVLIKLKALEIVE